MAEKKACKDRTNGAILLADRDDIIVTLLHMREQRREVAYPPSLRENTSVKLFKQIEPNP